MNPFWWFAYAVRGRSASITFGNIYQKELVRMKRRLTRWAKISIGNILASLYFLLKKMINKFFNLVNNVF